VQNNAALIVLQAPRSHASPLLTMLIRNRFEKFKISYGAADNYLCCLISAKCWLILTVLYIFFLVFLFLFLLPFFDGEIKLYILAAPSVEDRLQSGSAKVQSPKHVFAGIPSSPDPGSTTRPKPAIGHHDAVSTVYDDDICKARLPVLSSGCLELATENCYQ